MRDSLAKSLKDWDGKATAPLEELFADYHEHPGFLVTLVDFCETEELQRGATWLLKHHFDQKGPPLTDGLTRLHINSLPSLRHWDAKLHILQYFEQLRLRDDMEEALGTFVESELSSDNKMVRAWAYYDLAVLARRFPNRKEAAVEILTRAQALETAGSIKVRVRKALAKLKA